MVAISEIKKSMTVEATTTAAANCLMLLSKVGQDHQKRVFTCKTCLKHFNSFQALGGHRASHKKPNDENLSGLIKKSSKTTPSTHPCPICGVEFPMGQALGGHMRRHRNDIGVGGGALVTRALLPETVVTTTKKSSSWKRVACLGLSLGIVDNLNLNLELGRTSYESKGFWVLKNNEHTSEEEEEEDSVYDHSTRDDAKRPHPWFVDSSRPEMFFPNKKQAVQDPVGLGKPSVGPPSWESSSVFQSVSNQFMDRLLGTEMSRPPLLFGDRTEVIGSSSHHHQPKGIGEAYMEEDRSVELSISNGFGNDGIRKLQVSRVKEAMSAHGSLEGHHSQRKIEPCSLQACGRENESSSFVDFALVGHSYGGDDSHVIAFGEMNDEQGGVGSSANVVVNYQSYVQDPIGTSDIVYGQEETTQTNSGVVSEEQVAKPSFESLPKNKAEGKTSKKETSTSFPSNVRSLISTGMLDGVPVKYVSVSREELRGVIKGSGYLCGCQACDFTKVLNAYAFERHAGCKTKHPNNHIYFENGKTIYQIVQELRNTPETMLFDVIQTVFGSPINQKAFRIWKESFQAATRELQRIYGKEERCF
ncbi:unnamed protein product [Cochlearia groenlandica]